MAVVREYMNQDLVYLREGDRPVIALKPMLRFGLTTIPVLDSSHRPVGIVTLRDLIDHDEKVRSEMDVKTISPDATIESAARALYEDGLHHLVVVDSQGVAVGMLSTLDVMCALSKLPPRHPQTTTEFTHKDNDIQAEYER